MVDFCISNDQLNANVQMHVERCDLRVEELLLGIKVHYLHMKSWMEFMSQKYVRGTHVFLMGCRGLAPM